MKKVALMALAAIFTLSFSLTAQNKTDNGRDGRRGMSELRWTAKERVENMAKQLELTADQKAKVEALFEKQDALRKEQVARQQEKREEMTEDRAARRQEMMELRNKAVAENDAQLEQIIGKEKMEQWKTYRDEQMKKMRERIPSGQPGMRRNAPKLN